MRISDWSSDVCSSDLATGVDRSGGTQSHCLGGCRPLPHRHHRPERRRRDCTVRADQLRSVSRGGDQLVLRRGEQQPLRRDRKSVVSGKSVSVRVDLGGRRIIKKKITHKIISHSVYTTYI